MNNLKNDFKNNERIKSKQFTLDSKIFTRSLSDAIICTKQIAEMDCNKEIYYNSLSYLAYSKLNNLILLGKYCKHDICNVNIIAAKDLTAYENYFMMKFSVNLFLNYYDRLKNKKDYFSLGNELDKIYIDLHTDLSSYLKYIKNNH
jgi:hypothetical protein